jgi:PIN domain nuclease of toxin-antitoxin system
LTLVDTHVLIWHESGDRRLGPRARRAFGHAMQDGDAAVSAISFWEIGMCVRKGRLGLLLDPDAWRRDLLDQGLIEIPVDGGIASRAGLLAKIHGDPVDRIIVATALEGHRLMTADRQILEWSGPLSCLSASD